MVLRNIVNMAEMIGLSAEGLLVEAEYTDRYGEWLHWELTGYSVGELRKAALMIGIPM